MKVKFKLSSDGSLSHNLMDIIPGRKLSTDEVVDLAIYQSRLSGWWRYKYNSDQPTEIIRF